MSQSSNNSFAEDLQKCPFTGVGCQSLETAPEEILKYLYCQHENGNTYLYGICDAYNGPRAAKLILPRIAAEILYGELNSHSTDEEVVSILRDAFATAEEECITSLTEGTLTKKANLEKQLQTKKGNSDNIVKQLRDIDEILSNGATTVIALIHNDKLFVANVGESRALLCKTDKNNVLRVQELSVEHSLSNQEEVSRIASLGVDREKIQTGRTLGNLSHTRCLGNYVMKTLYQGFEEFKNTHSEPVTAVPDVCKPTDLKDAHGFLILMSDGLYKNFQKSTGTESAQVNIKFAQLVVEQFRSQRSLAAVCQAVMDHTMTCYRQYCRDSNIVEEKIDRSTLLIRNFNFPLMNAADDNYKPRNNVKFNPVVSKIEGKTPQLGVSKEIQSKVITEPLTAQENRPSSSNASSQNESAPTATHSPADYTNNNVGRTISSQRINSYVDFSQYYENVKKARLNGTLPPDF